MGVAELFQLPGVVIVSILMLIVVVYFDGRACEAILSAFCRIFGLYHYALVAGLNLDSSLLRIGCLCITHKNGKLW